MQTLRLIWLSGATTLILGGCAVDFESLGSETSNESSASGPCGVLEDDSEPNTYKTIRVLNSTDGPVWLPAAPCGGGEVRSRFLLTVDGVEMVDVAPPCALCSTSPCADGGKNHCCEGPGPSAGTIRIGAGESYDLEWQTYGFERANPPATCVDQPCGIDDGCRVGRNIAPGAMVQMRLPAVVECVGWEDVEGCGDCPMGETCVLQESDAGNKSFSIDEYDILGETSFELVLDDSIIELEFSS